MFIILASVIASYFYEKSLKNSIWLVSELIAFIKNVKSKIEYYSLSIDDILENYSTENEYIKGAFDGGCVDISHLDMNVNNDIKSFFSSLGKGYKKEQLSLCDYTLISLENALDKIKTEFTKKVRVFRSLSFFFGIGCVILLV